VSEYLSASIDTNHQARLAYATSPLRLGKSVTFVEHIKERGM
jgi:hypothetical protein